MHSLVGGCDVFEAFMGQLRQAAGSDATVLLGGESGTGKSLAGRVLHELGPRSTGPFRTVHVAALSPTLVDSELFGHERGAFTDAHRSRLGTFRLADGGTLLLDDVHLLPAPVQGKLLRVLQERVIDPLGAEQPVAVDVRVVATAGVDLRGEVEAGRFREDLYYRLAVIHLVVPPLRARLEDLPLLVEHFGRRCAERLGAPERPITPGALERMAAHPWPGNVRELENAIERVLVMPPAPEARAPGAAGGAQPGQPIEAAELEFLGEATAGLVGELARRVLAAGLHLDEISREILAGALEDQRGNVSAAARQVGLTRRAFEYRLNRPRDGEEGQESAGPGEASGADGA